MTLADVDRAGLAGDFWVFAYGSLIWNPGFAFLSREPARLAGYVRRYCVRSTFYRGAPEAPGLVLGLEPGAGHCDGVGYRVAGAARSETMLYLRERELITDVYDETLVSVETRAGRLHEAYAYVVRPGHAEHVLSTDFETLIETIATASGRAGLNADYALNTWANLEALGVEDAYLARVAQALTRRAARDPRSSRAGRP